MALAIQSEPADLLHVGRVTAASKLVLACPETWPIWDTANSMMYSSMNIHPPHLDVLSRKGDKDLTNMPGLSLVWLSLIKSSMPKAIRNGYTLAFQRMAKAADIDLDGLQMLARSIEIRLTSLPQDAP